MEKEEVLERIKEQLEAMEARMMKRFDAMIARLEKMADPKEKESA